MTDRQLAALLDLYREMLFEGLVYTDNLETTEEKFRYLSTRVQIVCTTLVKAQAVLSNKGLHYSTGQNNA